MLSAEHVRARRKAGQLRLSELDERGRARALELAEAYLAAAAASLGRARAELDDALAAVPFGARDRKLALGLRKLVEDRCDFGAEAALDPVAARQEVFLRAARARREAEEETDFDREAVLSQAAAELEVEPAALEASLYADLRDAHLLRAFQAMTAELLVRAYALAQEQAVLLRATRVCVLVHARSPLAYRHLFRKLKFHRLLYRAERATEGYRIEIDGPLSLFASSTKYGLALALVLPALRACDRFTLQADLLWGKRREPLSFRLEGRAEPSEREPARLAEDAQALLDRFGALESSWRCEIADDLLDLPGAGLCVPDLRFVHRETGEVAWLESMGFWSRDAVWKRVELVEAGLPYHVLFAVSSRLRVSEEVLGDDVPAALYVYKGTMSAKEVARRLDALVERPLAAR